MMLIITALVICIFILIIYIVIQKTTYNRHIDFLIDYVTKVQDKNSVPKIEEQAEGRMRILQSEIYKLSTALHEQYSRETEKNRYFADMLSDISHQLKTPLTAITIMTDLLKSDSLTERERRQSIHRINSQTDRITWLVRTLLAVAQLDAGVLNLKKENVNAEELIDEIFETLAVIADVKEVELNKDIHEQAVLICDRHWTYEALSNIIKNCLEHTDDGGIISVKISRSNISTDIVITDTGEGISEDDLPYIFDRFYRGRNSDSNSIGIGLALSKQIILNQNGLINVTSEKGKGSDFTIRFYHHRTI